MSDTPRTFRTEVADLVPVTVTLAPIPTGDLRGEALVEYISDAAVNAGGSAHPADVEAYEMTVYVPSGFVDEFCDRMQAEPGVDDAFVPDAWYDQQEGN